MEGCKMSEYLEFCIIEQKPKTMIVGLWSKKSSDRLGLIKWYPGWRQYAFFPENGTLFNTGCLSEIQDRIKRMMEGRRDEQKRRTTTKGMVKI